VVSSECLTLASRQNRCAAVPQTLIGGQHHGNIRVVIAGKADSARTSNFRPNLTQCMDRLLIASEFGAGFGSRAIAPGAMRSGLQATGPTRGRRADAISISATPCSRCASPYCAESRARTTRCRNSNCRTKRSIPSSPSKSSGQISSTTFRCASMSASM
jgi:hypothetical protein